MSEYFRVLKRMETEVPAAVPGAPRRAPRRPTAVRPATAELPLREPGVVRRVVPPGGAKSLSLLLEQIGRLLPLPSVVALTTVGGDRGAQTLAEQVTAHSGSVGLRVVHAELAESARQWILRQCGVGADDGCGALAVDAEADGTTLRAAIGQLRAEGDLVIIETPPVAQSREALCVAQACDGLLIGVETGVTSRESLQAAVECARAARCHLLGLVMHGMRGRLPQWLTELIGETQIPLVKGDE